MKRKLCRYFGTAFLLAIFSGCVSTGGSYYNAASYYSYGKTDYELLTDAVRKGIQTGNTSYLQSLIANGIDVNARDEDGNTVLMGLTALNSLYADFVLPLINAGLDVNAQDNNGDTALHYAPDGDAVEILLMLGANINIQDSNGDTAADFCAYTGRWSAYRELLKAGASPNEFFPYPGNMADGMQYICRDEFEMGDKRYAFPVHKVILDSFYISDFKITIAQWMDEIGYYPEGWAGNREYSKYIDESEWENTPVRNVSWYDAILYCNRRSVAEGLTPCYASNGSKDTVTYSKQIHGEFKNVTCDWKANGYRLPTEAEWEYAAKHGLLSEALEGGPEWCWDLYSSTYYQESRNAKNPKGPASGERVSSSGTQSGEKAVCRVTRGGEHEKAFPGRGHLAPYEFSYLIDECPPTMTFRVVRNKP